MTHTPHPVPPPLGVLAVPARTPARIMRAHARVHTPARGGAR